MDCRIALGEKTELRKESRNRWNIFFWFAINCSINLNDFFSPTKLSSSMRQATCCSSIRNSSRLSILPWLRRIHLKLRKSIGWKSFKSLEPILKYLFLAKIITKQRDENLIRRSLLHAWQKVKAIIIWLGTEAIVCITQRIVSYISFT